MPPMVKRATLRLLTSETLGLVIYWDGLGEPKF